jgi:hypothetical protein
LWEGVVSVSCGFFGSWGFFFPLFWSERNKKEEEEEEGEERESMQ